MRQSYKIIFEDQEFEVLVEESDAGFELGVGGEKRHFAILLTKKPLYSFLIDGSEVLEADIAFKQDRCSINIKNIPYEFQICDPRHQTNPQALDTSPSQGTLQAPMPGKVVEVKIANGDTVKEGQSLVIIEAMKMQNELQAPKNGTIQKLLIKPGDTVESGQNLLSIE